MTPYYADDWLTVYLGDCRAILAELPADSVHCVITSPPYYGLRDYGTAGQIGLEPTPEQYVAELVAVFREVRRVLRPDGTVWLNLGDSYAAQRGHGAMPAETLAGGDRGRGDDDTYRGRPRADRLVASEIGLKHKDRMMIPARVALALQADGWWLRDEIVWSKPNPMPSSVTDRTTPAHEMVYLLTKRAGYWYDADAVREPHTTPDGMGWAANGKGTRYSTSDYGDHRGAADFSRHEGLQAMGGHPLGRNKRSVWTIATQPYPEAHFATFPEALVEPMILAGCPEGGTLLDPFAGSGTVGLVAQRHSRRAILIDLSAEYMKQLLLRNAQMPMGLAL